jgi:hypothetical protein
MNSKVELRIGAQAVHVIGRTAVLARLVQGVGVACLLSACQRCSHPWQRPASSRRDKTSTAEPRSKTYSASLQALNGLGAGKSRQREQRQGPDSHHGDGVAL